MTDQPSSKSDPVTEFQKLPFRVFFDTNVVQNIVTFGEYILENYLSPKSQRKMKSLPSNLRSDLNALACFLTPVTRTPVRPVVSTLTLEELKDSRRHDLLQYGFELLEYATQDSPDAVPLSGSSFKQKILVDYLPHPKDRLLLFESKRADCEAFLSMDYRSILRFKIKLRAEGFNVLSPSEYWEILQPWYGLFA